MTTEDAAPKHRFDISLEDLQTFIAVANLEGIGRAARHLNLSQPSVSNRMRRLEDKLGVRLLERGERGVRLTPHGQELHQQAVDTLVGLNELMQRFHGAGGTRDLSLSVTTPMAQIKLPCIINDFREAHANVAVHVHEQNAYESMDALTNGRCELAFATCDEPSETLDYDLLVLDDCALVTSLTHPLNKVGGATLEEALGHPILFPGDRYPQMVSVYRAVESRGLVMKLAPEAEGVRHPLTLIAMAAAGLGVFISPKTLIPAEVGSAVATVAISNCPIPRRFGLARVKERRLSPQARAFRAFVLAARAPDHSTWPDGRRARLQPGAAADRQPHPITS